MYKTPDITRHDKPKRNHSVYPIPQSADIPDPRAILAREKEIMLRLRNDIRGDLVKDWDENKPVSEWCGVTTTEDGRVSEIEIEYSDYVPINILVYLRELEKLKSISITSEHGDLSLPIQLPVCTSIEELYFSYDRNNNDVMPECWNAFPNLKSLSLPVCGFTGSFPGVGKLQKLKCLDLSWNFFSAIPKEICNLKNLEQLSLYFNDLFGKLPPSLCDLSGLTGLHLNRNVFSGPIPEEIGKLKKLQYLDLRDNHFSGPIPDALFELPDLDALCLARTELDPPHFEDILKLRKLRVLFLASLGVSGPIPSALFDLPLKQLGLSHNQLTGTIPERIGENLKFFYCSHNQLSGSIPAAVFNVGKIKLSHNSLSGALLETFITGKWMQLDLSYNQLSGEIPWEVLDRLDELNRDDYMLALQLDLSHNQFSGVIPLLPPSWIKCLPEEVSFKYNCLTGLVPVDAPVYMDFDREQIIEAYKSLFFPQNEGYGLITP